MRNYSLVCPMFLLSMNLISMIEDDRGDDLKVVRIPTNHFYKIDDGGHLMAYGRENIFSDSGSGSDILFSDESLEFDDNEYSDKDRKFTYFSARVLCECDDEIGCSSDREKAIEMWRSNAFRSINAEMIWKFNKVRSMVLDELGLYDIDLITRYRFFSANLDSVREEISFNIRDRSLQGIELIEEFEEVSRTIIGGMLLKDLFPLDHDLIRGDRDDDMSISYYLSILPQEFLDFIPNRYLHLLKKSIV